MLETRAETVSDAEVAVFFQQNASRLPPGTEFATVEASIREPPARQTQDALVVAPATANILAKFARGVADDFLSTFYVSVTAPVVVAPAMNTRMAPRLDPGQHRATPRPWRARVPRG